MTAKIIKINMNRFGIEELGEAIDVLRKGGVIVYPTDTVYGVGGVIDRQETILRVVEIKKRGSAPFPIIVSNIEKAMELGHFNSTAKKLAEEFWPGPLTIKVEAKKQLHERLVDQDNKVALRIPDCKVAVSLASSVGGALIGTSANISGRAPPVEVDDVVNQIGSLVDIIVDGGPTKYGRPSTIIDASVSPPLIIRVGAVAPESIEEYLGVKIKIKA